MHKAFRVRFPRVALGVFGLATFGGCLDFGSDGSNGSSTPQGIVDDIAAGVSSAVVESTVEVLQGVSEWTSGGGRETAIWDGEKLAWIITDSENYEDRDISGQLDVTYEVQFREGGEPKKSVNDLTDEVAVVVKAESIGDYHPDLYEVDFAWAAEANLTVFRNQDGNTSLVGGGTLDGITTTHYQGEAFADEQKVSWTSEFTAEPDDACVRGSLLGGVDDHMFTAIFNGAGRVDWTVHRGSMQIEASGRDYDCGF